MKYFVFATLFISLTSSVCAQDFFVPGNAFSKAQDRLPSPVRNADQSEFSQRRYRILDGRVYPVEDNPVVVNTQNAPTKPASTQEHAVIKKSPTQQTMPIPSNQPQTADTTLKTGNRAQPTSQKTNENAKNLPLASAVPDANKRSVLYQELFKTYTAEKESFKKQHKFPKNQELEDVLSKFKQPHTITLFENSLQ